MIISAGRCFCHLSIRLMQVLILKGLSLTIRYFTAGLHLLPPPYLTRSILPFSVWQVLSVCLFNSRKETFAWGRICHLFPETKKKKKMKRGFSTLCLSPFLSSVSTHLRSLHHCGVSASSSGFRALTLSSGWEVQESTAGLMHCGLGDLARRMKDEFFWLSSKSVVQKNWTNYRVHAQKMHTHQVLMLYAHFLYSRALLHAHTH